MRQIRLRFRIMLGICFLLMTMYSIAAFIIQYSIFIKDECNSAEIFDHDTEEDCS